MRRSARRWALVAVVTPMVAFACSSFEAEETPAPAVEAGTESSIDDAPGGDGGADAGPGCPKGACGIVLAPAEPTASEVVADEMQVFWTTATEVRTITPDGGVRTIAGPNERPKSPALANGYVYYATGSVVHVIGRNGDNDGGTKATVAATTNFVGGGEIRSSIRAGGVVFFTSGQKLYRCTPAPSSEICGGATVDSESFQGQPAALTLGPSGRLWFTDSVDLVDVTPSPYSATEKFNVNDVRALALDQTQIFFAKKNDNAIYALAMDAASSERGKVIATAATPPYALAVDDTYVYFTNLEAGTVSKVAKNGGPIVHVATELASPKGIALQFSRVIVAEGGRILSLPKGN